MNQRRYEEPRPAGPTDVTRALASGDSQGAAAALVGTALFHPDWHATQDLCLELLEGPDRRLAAVAATCLGHVARLHRRLDDVEAVLATLGRYRDDDLIGPRAADAMDDIESYVLVGGASDSQP
jgi:predicted component of type VI protein secretion system